MAPVCGNVQLESASCAQLVSPLRVEWWESNAKLIVYSFIVFNEQFRMQKICL